MHIDNVSKKLWFDLDGCQGSGGEQTFALLAFLIALQDCVDLPFFFMDEFDVYLVTDTICFFRFNQNISMAGLVP